MVLPFFLRCVSPASPGSSGLSVVKAQLARTYGKRVVFKARANEGGCVDPRVSAGLLFQTDPSLLLPGGGKRARRSRPSRFSAVQCIKHVPPADGCTGFHSRAPPYYSLLRVYASRKLCRSTRFSRHFGSWSNLAANVTSAAKFLQAGCRTHAEWRKLGRQKRLLTDL